MLAIMAVSSYLVFYVLYLSLLPLCPSITHLYDGHAGSYAGHDGLLLLPHLDGALCYPQGDLLLLHLSVGLLPKGDVDLNNEHSRVTVT